MKLTSFLLLLCVSVAVATPVDLDQPLERDDIIEAVNNAKTTWKAGRNFDNTITKRYAKHLTGTILQPSKLPILVDDEDENLEIPASFDARKKWKHCTNLQEIQDQGPCGSCWAVAAVGALSDRVCIASKGSFNGHLSAEDLLSCCCPCAVSCGQGCKGGRIDFAWDYFMQYGVVTGGAYNSDEGCQPYTLPTCEHHVPGTRKNCSDYGDVPTPTCQRTCYNQKYKDHDYDKDHHFTSYAFTLSSDVTQIQKELLKHGPLEAAFRVYEDFFTYKSGVYQHVAGDLVGGHGVKVIGWGTEDGTDYWLVANSWNTDWGDNGFFKIKRGTNECLFESHMSGGTPKTK